MVLEAACSSASFASCIAVMCCNHILENSAPVALARSFKVGIAAFPCIVATLVPFVVELFVPAPPLVPFVPIVPVVPVVLLPVAVADVAALTAVSLVVVLIPAAAPSEPSGSFIAVVSVPSIPFHVFFVATSTRSFSILS